eukprot:TRINITY_DN2830_c0_g1_i3.p2 TRINITY_DN2830_c0_g1~~TRINITY_DN2830_c0_g1_i3.p2  ORF type:complete len:101 (-),score=20.62 TRINITY_DN2830_c0_g1_i3:255-557(-)
MCIRDRFPILEFIGGCYLLAVSAFCGAGAWMPPFCLLGSARFWDLTANVCVLVVYLGGAYTHAVLEEPTVPPLVFTGIGLVRLALKASDQQPKPEPLKNQ